MLMLAKNHKLQNTYGRDNTKQAEIFIEIAGGRKSLIRLERKQEYSK